MCVYCTLCYSLPEPLASRTVDGFPVLQPLDGWSWGSLSLTDQLNGLI